MNPYIFILEEHCRNASHGDYKPCGNSCIMSAVALEELLKACKITLNDVISWDTTNVLPLHHKLEARCSEGEEVLRSLV